MCNEKSDSSVNRSELYDLIIRDANSLTKDNYVDFLTDRKFVRQVHQNGVRDGRKGLYVIRSNNFNEDHAKLWVDHQHSDDLKVSLINANSSKNSILYVGKVTGGDGSVNARINLHIKGSKDTYSLALEKFNKILAGKGIETLQYTGEMYVLSRDAISGEFLDIYVRYYESLLHHVLKPRIGSSR